VLLLDGLNTGFISTVIPIEIWDCPGNTTVETLGAPLSWFSSLIFVIDIRVSVILNWHEYWMNPQQDLYNQAISKLVEFIVAAFNENPDMNLEVFVHKAEKLQDDDKIGKRRSSIFYTLSCKGSRKRSYF
jgi:Ras-related GTP-binding protein C/D